MCSTVPARNSSGSEQIEIQDLVIVPEKRAVFHSRSLYLSKTGLGVSRPTVPR